MLLCLPFLGGCSTLAKQVLRELRGAKGELRLGEGATVPDDAFRSIARVEFDRVRTSLPSRLCPPTLLADYDEQSALASERLATELADDGATGTLRVASEIIYFQKKGLLSEALLLTRIQIRDGTRLFADGVVVVESKSFRERKTDDLAETAVGTIEKFIEDAAGDRDDDEADSDAT